MARDTGGSPGAARLLDEAEVRVALVRGDFLQPEHRVPAASRHVIDGRDAKAALVEEEQGEVGANEAGRPRNQDGAHRHGLDRPRLVRRPGNLRGRRGRLLLVHLFVRGILLVGRRVLGRRLRRAEHIRLRRAVRRRGPRLLARVALRMCCLGQAWSAYVHGRGREGDGAVARGLAAEDAHGKEHQPAHTKNKGKGIGPAGGTRAAGVCVRVHLSPGLLVVAVLVRSVGLLLRGGGRGELGSGPQCPLLLRHTRRATADALDVRPL